jgi:hypothetical protein
VSAQGREWAEQQEHEANNAPRVLTRIRSYLRRDHGIIVQGDMFVHALKQLTQPEPEPTLDAGWPNPEKNR